MCANPVRNLGDLKTTGVESIRMSICNPDNSGRSEPVPVEGSRFIIGADDFIQAIG